MHVKNRSKELDLIDRVPEELWMEVCDIVEEAVIKTTSKKKQLGTLRGLLLLLLLLSRFSYVQLCATT